MDDDLKAVVAELERLAKDATAGPWKACGTIYEHMKSEVRGGTKGEGQPIAQVWDGPTAFKDGQWIAAANPATVLRLIAALRQRDEALEKASEAMAEVIQWDKARGYRMPYRVRDPLFAAIDRNKAARAILTGSETNAR